MAANVPDPLKPLKPSDISTLGLKVTPAIPPTTEERPGMTWCELAWVAFWRAWNTWSVDLGFDAFSYKVGTRALTRVEEFRAYDALRHAIQMVLACCGEGYLPPGLEDMSGRPLAQRVILTDS